MFNATCGRSCDLRDHHRFKTEWSYENLLTGSPILAVDRFGTQIGGKGLPFIEASITKAKAEFQEQKIVNTIAKKSHGVRDAGWVGCLAGPSRLMTSHKHFRPRRLLQLEVNIDHVLKLRHGVSLTNLATG